MMLFEYIDPAAAAVAIAGTFNDWNPAGKLLRRAMNGHWLGETALLPGLYEYCLVVDGRWLPDPNVDEGVTNPFGGKNSLLWVPCLSTDPWAF